ncbi:MAG: type II toxin-antitoxin system VapB family antitoxin [Bacteroidota bacterium]
MKTTLELDHALMEQARNLTGIHDQTALIHAGLNALIERESARLLAQLGGSDPNAHVSARRRF